MRRRNLYWIVAIILVIISATSIKVESANQDRYPHILWCDVYPKKANVGDELTVFVASMDRTGISQVKAFFYHEKGFDVVNLSRIFGTEFLGGWSGKWKVHDTVQKNYSIIIEVVSRSGKTICKSLAWRDPYPWWNMNWRYRKPITIHNPSSEDLYEYQVFINISYNPHMKSDFSDLRFTWYNSTADREEEIPYYIEEKVDSEWVTVWVKVTELKNNTDTTIHVYYGNSDATSASNISATFSYSEPRTIGYVVSDKIVNNGIKILSLCDNNTIVIGDHTFHLDEQEAASIPAGDVQIGDAIKVKGLAQIEGAGNVDDIIVPISWAGTLFIYGGMRDSNDTFCMLCPWGTANVKIYDGSALEWSGTVDSSGVCVTNDITSGHAVRIESDIPILVFRYGKGGSDAWAFYPATTDYLYGPSVSNSAYVAAGSEGATVSYVASNGNSGTKDVGANSQLNLASYVGSGSSGSGPAIRIKGSKPIGAIQQADHDGTESTVFVPLKEMGNKFGSAIAAEYIVVAAPYPNTVCKVYDSSGNLIETKTGGSRNDINWIGFGTGSDDTYVQSGWKLESNKPVWVYYEADDNGDETNLLGYKQMRQYVYPEPTYSIGEEEVAKPSKPQLLEPENGGSTNDDTPTLRWEPAMNADNHTLLIDNDDDFSSPKVTKILGPTANSYTLNSSEALPEGKWYWKVKANNSYGENESDVWSFIVDKTPPLPPKLISPSNGYATDDNEVTFIWNATQDNTTNSSYISGIAYYEIQIDDDPNFTSPLITDTTTGTSITEQVEGRLYWRVRAWDKAGNPGIFSEVRNFTVFSYSIETSSGELQMQRGSSASLTLSLDLDYGDPENITLNYTWIGENKPSNIDVIFEKNNETLPFDTMVIFSSGSSATTGTFICRIIATSDYSGIQRTIDVSITIYSMLFSMSSFPQIVPLIRSDEGNVTIYVEFDQGALDEVTLSGGWRGEEPDGVTVSISPSGGTPPFEATVNIKTSSNAEKGNFVYQVTGTGSGLTRVQNIYITISTDLTLTLETDKEVYERGDQIKISGIVKDPNGDPADGGEVSLTISSGNWSTKLSAPIHDGTYSASFYITFDKPIGNWSITASAKDGRGDETPQPVNKTISVTNPEGYHHYSINIIKPSFGEIFYRGDTVTFTISLTDGDDKVGGATVVGKLSNGDEVRFSETSFGIYTGSYRISYDADIGNWSIYIEASKEVDGELIEGFNYINFRVEKVEPQIESQEDIAEVVEIGDVLEIKIRATYPDGTPIENGIVKAIMPNGKEIVFDNLGSGFYVGKFVPSDEDKGNWSIKIMVEDAFGNAATFTMGETKFIPPKPTTYLIRYWWATLLSISAMASVMGYVGYRGLLVSRLREIDGELEELQRLKKVAATRYFLKGEITRETYDKLIQEYESRMAQLSKKKGVLEKKIRRMKRRHES